MKEMGIIPQTDLARFKVKVVKTAIVDG